MREFIFYCGDDFIKTAKSINNTVNLSSAHLNHKVLFKMAGEQNFATHYSGKINAPVITSEQESGLRSVLISGVNSL